MLARIASRFCLAVALLVTVVGCDEQSPNAQKSQLRIDIAPAAQEIVSGVGSVQKTVTNGTQGPIFVFEEYHTSRLGQLQIATMLTRLHDKHALRKIGLEGAIWSGQPLDATSYQHAGGDQARLEREDLGVRMLAEGEISSAEFMAMEFPDIQVYGIESASEYDQTLNAKSNPEIVYLLAIAEKSLSPTDANKVAHLLNSHDKKKVGQAFEYMLTSDPWVKQRYEALKNSKPTSSEESISQLRDLQNKAREVGASVDPKDEAALEQIIQFYQTASKRSSTMVDKILDLAAGSPGQPIGMIVGAAHTDKVAELLTQRNAVFAVIRPVDLDPKYGSLTAEQFERKSNGKWAHNAPGTLGHVLNSYHKPPPIIFRTTGESYASMNLAGMLIAKAARSGGPIPDSIWPQLSSLPGIRIDRNSFARDGYDIIYRAWLLDDSGKETEVWARVGTTTKRTLSGGSAQGTLEQKLLRTTEEMKKAEEGESGGGGKKPPGDVPPGSKPDESEGPGDSRRRGVVISATGLDTLAVYGAKRQEVMRVGHISD